MPARTIVQHGYTSLEKERVRFNLVRVAGRRNVHVLVDDDGNLSVRAPWRYSLKLARAAIDEHQNWVTGRLHAAAESRRRRPKLVTGSELVLLDERLTLDIRIDAQLPLLPNPAESAPIRGRPSHLLAQPGGTVYRNRHRLCVELQSLQPGLLPELLKAWFRQRADERLPSRLKELAAALGVSPAGVRIRAQRSRWGSCSSNGRISLNWRLVMLPLELADYVLVHELCHLRHMDHSEEFWNLVASAVPDYLERRERIARFQPRLAL